MEAGSVRSELKDLDAALPAAPWKAVAQPLPWRGFSVWVTALTCAASDALALGFASLFGIWFWAPVNPEVVLLYHPAWAVVGLGLSVNAVLRLYPGIGIGAVETMRRTTISCSIVHMVLTAALFVAGQEYGISRGAFLISWVLSIVLVPTGRSVLTRLFGRSNWWGVPVVVMGAARTGRMVIKQARDNPALGLKPVACFDDDPSKHGVFEGVPVVGPLKDAVEFGRAHRVHYAIVAMPGVARLELVGHLEQWSTVFSHVIVIPDLFGITSLGITPLDLGGVLGLQIRYNLLNPLNRIVKRTLDIIVSLVVSVLALPLLGVCALAIMIVSPGPPIFTQEREGERGRKIRVYKLRTMYLDAEHVLQGYLSKNPEARQEWERFFKLKKDPRILKGIGNLLRRTSLDELPQLWNVFLGQMSLVGPRPFPAYHNRMFDPAFRDLRLRVTPGLTGLWQVSARSDGDLEVQADLDSYYIRNWSVWLDAYLLVRTAGVVLFPRGAY